MSILDKKLPDAPVRNPRRKRMIFSGGASHGRVRWDCPTPPRGRDKSGPYAIASLGLPPAIRQQSQDLKRNLHEEH